MLGPVCEPSSTSKGGIIRPVVWIFLNISSTSFHSEHVKLGKESQQICVLFLPSIPPSLSLYLPLQISFFIICISVFFLCLDLIRDFFFWLVAVLVYVLLLGLAVKWGGRLVHECGYFQSSWDCLCEWIPSFYYFNLFLSSYDRDNYI